MKEDKEQNSNFPHEPLAIIGASCCVPGAFSPEEYWDNLSHGKVSISALPDARFPFDIYKSETNGVWGKSHTNIAGVVDFKEFNERHKPAFIQDLIAGGVDPSSIPGGTGVLFAVYTAFNAIKSSGYNPFQMPTIPYGVFTGMVRLSEGYMFNQIRNSVPWMKQVFQDSAPELSEDIVNTVWDDFKVYWSKATDRLTPYFSREERGIPHHTSRSIQELFNLRGLGFTFDSACATSLAALYIAEHFLTLHPEGMALCGGLTLASKNSINLFSFNKANSGNGSCPFDENADGLVQGEGCSYLLVRPLSAAIKANDNILGILRGIGVTCDGKGKGLWAPSVKGQKLAITRAWEDSYLNPNDSLDYIEAHATSTRLGDATELESLEEFLEEKKITKPIPITSVKANIGHLLEAAGATSAIKVLQSLRHQTILPQASFENPTTKFDWNSSPIYVQREIKSWPVVKNKRRLALVDAFGIGGLNASAIFEGPESAQQTNEETRKPPFSAQAIAIVGIGCVAPSAFDAKEFRNRVKRGENVMTPAPEDRSDLFLTRTEFQELSKRGIKAGFIDNYQYDWKRHNMPPKQIKLGHVLQFWTLGAVDQAIDDAGMPQNIKQSAAQPERWDRTRTAIVVGSKSSTDFVGSIIPVHYLCDLECSIRDSLTKIGFDVFKAQDVANRFHDSVLKKFPHNEDQTGGFSISTLGSRISKAYDINGPSVSLDGGYSASMSALATAFNILQDARVECALCVSGDRAQGKPLHEILNSSDDSITPPSESAVAFVLKRTEDALANGDKIYAIIRNIEVESPNIHVQEKTGVTAKTTMRMSNSSELRDIDEPLTKVFGDFGPSKGMMALTNVLIDMQEQNQTVPSSWQIQQKDCEGISVTIDMENTAAYKENSKKPEVNSVIPAVEPSRSSLRYPGSRVAFLFTGQGAQYPDMMSSMTELPGAREIIAEIDDSLTSVGLPDFKTVLQTEGAKLGKDTFRTQLSLLIADTFIYRLYESQGVHADVLMGHSYGEYPAMTAAGVWSFQTAALATQIRCQAIETALEEFTAKRTRTAMLSTNASEDQIEEAMATIPDAATTIFISNRNAPTQTIIAGTYNSIKKMEKFLLSCQRLALILPVPAAFHSPLMEGVCKPFADGLKPLSFDLPEGLLLSSVTTAFESDPDVFRSNLVEQMTKPVDFISMIRKAYNVGCRHFVEIGPKKILTNLARQILSDCSDVTFYTSDNGKGGDPEKFMDVCRQLVNIQNTEPSINKPVIKMNIDTQDARREPAALQSSSQTSELSSVYSVSVCRQSGTPYQMGLQYGKQYSQELRAMVRRYVDVVGMAAENLLPPAPAMDKESLIIRFGEDGLEEMRGMADGAGIPLEALVRHNVCLYPTQDTSEQKKLYNAGKSVHSNTIKMNTQSLDRVASGCVQFAGTTPNGAFIHGCNIDLPFKRIVPDSVQIQIQTRQPSNRISHCFVGVTGMLGTIGGINSRGLCVTSCTLLDYPTPFQVKPEAMEHSTLIEKILSECSNIDQALKVIYKNGSIGGWTIGLTESATGAIAQVEYCDRMVVHRDAIDFLVQANHSHLLVKEHPERGIQAPEHSRIRENRLRQILTNDGSEKSMAVDALTAFAALRDVKAPNQKEKPSAGAFRTINMLLRVDNVCSWMFNHTAQTLMVASTPDVYVSEDDKALWNEIPIRELLPDYDASVANPEPKAQVKKEVPIQTETPAEQHFSMAEIAKYTPAQLCKKIAQEADGLAKTITGRFIECLVEAPELPDAFSTIPGRTLIFGSEKNPVVASLVRQLKTASDDVVVYDGCVNNVGKTDDVIISEIDAIWNQSPVCNIFVVPSWDDNDPRKFSASDWIRTKDATIMPLYIALRQIYRCANAQKAVGNLRLVAGVRLGGDGGFAGYSDRLEGGAISGIVRVLHEENLGTFHAKNNFKTVDFSLNAKPDFVANTLIKELAHFDFQPDICYQSEKRYFLTIVPEVIPDSAIDAAPAPKPGEVWLITGGARGVTAELAYYLAKKRNAKLYLLASSPLPNIDPTWRNLDEDGLKELKQKVVRAALAEKKKPASEWSKVEKAIEIDKNLRRLDEAKIPWTYMACDLSSYENAAQAVKQIVRQEGRIAGILHGAGVEKSTTFYKKDERFVRLTIDVKVGSLWSILETLEGNLPDYIVMMGSAAGRLGGNGQTDYGLSNYMSSKMLNRYSAVHPQCRTYTVHWNAWDEVGMSVRPESLFAFKSMGMAMMPVKEGCDHFYNELIIDKYQPELCPLPYKVYEDVNLKQLEESGISLKNEEVKNDLQNESCDENAAQDSAADFDWVFGSNADAYELRNLLQKTQLSQMTPVLMVCRDEQLSRLMTKAQIMQRQKTVDKSALEWVNLCKRIGAEKIIVPTSSPADPITLEFIESVKAILPVEQIAIPWITEPAQCAQAILTVLQGGKVATEKKEEKSTSTPNSKPALLSNICSLTEDAIEAECTIDPVNDVFLQQHQLKGRPILPIVVGLEFIAETANVLSEKRGLGALKAIYDVKIIRGMACTQDAPYRLVCRLEKTSTPNVWEAFVKGDFYNKAGKKINENCPYYNCKVMFGRDDANALVPQPTDVLGKKYDLNYPKFGEKAIYHGPVLQCLKAVRYNDGSFAVGDVYPQDTAVLFGSRTGLVATNPAVLDACLYACGVLTVIAGTKAITVPDGFDRIEYGPGRITPDEKCACCMKFNGVVTQTGGYQQALTDLTLYNGKGEVAFNVVNYRATILPPQPQPESADRKSPALINRICSQTNSSIEVECIVDPNKDVFLLQHQIKEVSVLPFVIGVELIAEAAQILAEKAGLPPLTSLKNFKILRGIVCTQKVPYRLVCQIAKDASGVWTAWIKGDLYNKDGKLTNQNCPFYRCIAEFGSQDDLSKEFVPVNKKQMSKTVQAQYPDLGEAPLYQGPVLRRLNKCSYDDGSYLIGELTPQDSSILLSPHDGCSVTNPAVLDATIYACAVLYQANGGKGSVIPDQFGRISFGSGNIALADNSCYCCAEFVKAITLPGGYEQKIFNVTLYNDKDEVVVSFYNYQATIVK